MVDAARLHLDALVTGYGNRCVVDGVTLSVGRGEIVALVGHNGSGKSTVLKAAFGILPLWSGSVLVDGAAMEAARPRHRLKSGVSYVPQGNGVFGALTVQENLEVATTVLDRTTATERIDHVLALFPALKPRLNQQAATLSGGEKQMLALAGAWTLSPSLLLLDEPSLGLAPIVARTAMERIERVCQESGASVLIVEQRVREVLKIASRLYVLRSGRISFAGDARSIHDDESLRNIYL